jgi:alpha-beta hydrolase superfamily lysophospholipase
LFWQAWDPHAPPAGAVVVVHGAAEHGGRYAYVAEQLGAACYATYALDHRGHGRSDGPRALIGRFEHLVEDLRLLVTRVTEEQDGRRPFLLGHSLGAAVALTLAIRHGSEIAGLAVSGPAVATAAVPLAVKAAATLLSVMAPRLPVLKIDATAISRDPEVVRAYERDPLNHNDRLPAGTLAEVMRGMDRMPRLVGALRTPLLLLHGSEDRLCPPTASRMVHSLAPSHDKTLKIYDGLYHEVFNEPERAQVVGDLVAWIVERTQPAGPHELATP